MTAYQPLYHCAPRGPDYWSTGMLDQTLNYRYLDLINNRRHIKGITLQTRRLSRHICIGTTHHYRGCQDCSSQWEDFATNLSVTTEDRAKQSQGS
jgi:hypothetical protein